MPMLVSAQRAGRCGRAPNEIAEQSGHRGRAAAAPELASAALKLKGSSENESAKKKGVHLGRHRCAGPGLSGLRAARQARRGGGAREGSAPEHEEGDDELRRARALATTARVTIALNLVQVRECVSGLRPPYL